MNVKMFLLAVIAGVVGTAIYKTIGDSAPPAPPQIGTSTGGGGFFAALYQDKAGVPLYCGVAAQAGHGDAIVNAMRRTDYYPAFGADANPSSPLDEWTGVYSV